MLSILPLFSVQVRVLLVVVVVGCWLLVVGCWLFVVGCLCSRRRYGPGEYVSFRA